MRLICAKENNVQAIGILLRPRSPTLKGRAAGLRGLFDEEADADVDVDNEGVGARPLESKEPDDATDDARSRDGTLTWDGPIAGGLCGGIYDGRARLLGGPVCALNESRIIERREGWKHLPL